MQQPSLKNALLTTLSARQQIVFRKIELSLVSLHPLKLMDIYGYSCDVGAIEQQVSAELNGQWVSGINVVLYNWGFDIKKNPQGQEYYFELFVDEFELFESTQYINRQIKFLGDDLQVQDSFQELENGPMNAQNMNMQYANLGGLYPQQLNYGDDQGYNSYEDEEYYYEDGYQQNQNLNMGNRGARGSYYQNQGRTLGADKGGGKRIKLNDGGILVTSPRQYRDQDVEMYYDNQEVEDTVGDNRIGLESLIPAGDEPEEEIQQVNSGNSEVTFNNINQNQNQNQPKYPQNTATKEESVQAASMGLGDLVNVNLPDSQQIKRENVKSILKNGPGEQAYLGKRHFTSNSGTPIKLKVNYGDQNYRVDSDDEEENQSQELPPLCFKDVKRAIKFNKSGFSWNLLRFTKAHLQYLVDNQEEMLEGVERYPDSSEKKESKKEYEKLPKTPSTFAKEQPVQVQ